MRAESGLKAREADVIRSMTAFERRERQDEWGKLSCELRSVNHRYLDITPRLPEELRHLEPAMRERLSARLSRGKLECVVRFRATAQAAGDVELDWTQVDKLLSATTALSQRIGAAAALDPLELLRMPGVVKENERDLEPVAMAALALLDETIQGFIEAREREGTRLAELLSERVAKLRVLVAQVRERRPEVNRLLREKLTQRLREFAINADPGRLEQEMALLAQRLDVDEELDRLDTHIAEVERVLKRREPVGRRLDFLMQELNREANTLSSKSSDSETTQAAVEMKVLIEQMREQVQNIE